MAHDVFISYSSADKAVADAVCAALEQRKIRCWIAPRDVLAGTNWSASIVRAIGESKVMVLIFSGKANKSEQIKREVERAVHKAIPILPFRIENVLPSGDLEYFLSLPHWLDAMTPPLEAHLRSLARTVQALLAPPAPERARPPSAPAGKPGSKAAAPRPRWKISRQLALVAAGVLVLGLVGFGLWALLAGHGGRPPDAKDVGMKLVPIPAGEFRMGVDEAPQSVIDLVPPGEALSSGDERPAHRVRITRPFHMGTYEVTVGQFRVFVEATGYQTDAERDGGGGNGLNPNSLKIVEGPKYTWKYTGFPQTDDHPVVNVSWNDAAAFCDWLSKQEGVEYRLPTEAEWEYACRAGGGSFFGPGDDVGSLEPYANLADVALREKWPHWFVTDWNDGHPFTAPVGTFKPNAFGLYDMHGNVAEWCADWYNANAYRSGDREDPRGPPTGSHRVCRGSWWWCHPIWSGASHRPSPLPDDPDMNKPEYRCMNYGFRVVKVAPP